MILGNPNGAYRNAAGYSDPTAYLAIRNTERAKPMLITTRTKEIESGETWKAESKSGEPQIYLAVKPLESHVFVLEVTNREPDKGAIGLLVGTSMNWVSTEGLFTARRGAFRSLIRKLTEDEFAEVKNGIVCSLGLETNAVAEIAESPLEELKRKLAEQEQDLKIIRMEAELQMYKEFVEKLGGTKNG